MHSPRDAHEPRILLRRLSFGVAALALACGVFVAQVRADTIYTEDGRIYRGRITDETDTSLTIETNVGPVTVARWQISRVERDADVRETFDRRWRELRYEYDPDAFYELGVWARDRDMLDDADACFRKALEVDSFHADSHRALGHRLHQGRWYTEDEYMREVEGLTWYDGRWITPEDRDMIDMGFVQDDQGNWVRPGHDTSMDDDWRPEPRRPRPARPDPRPEPARPQPRPRDPAPLDPPPPAREDGEDLDWYNDHTTETAWGNAPVHESRFYRIRTNVRSEYAERYGDMMDLYYGKFVRVFRDFMPNGDIPKSDIWIYASQQEFMSSEGMGQTVGGFYNTGNKRVTAYHGMFGQNGTTRTVLAHEGTHQFEDIVLQGSFRNCPIWILEGLAVFFESAFYDGDDVIVGLVPHDRLAALKRGIQTNSLIPLSDLIRTPQPQFSGYHYAHAWGFIYFILYYSESRSVRDNTRQWFADLFMSSRQGPVTPDMVIERCGGRERFLELEQRWIDWIRDLPYDFDPR